MPYCPFISYGKQYTTEVDCMGEECMLWSHNRDSCLIRLTLLKYVSDVATGKEESVEDKLKKLERQVQMASIGFPTYPFEVSPKGMGLNTAEYPPGTLKGIGGDTIV